MNSHTPSNVISALVVVCKIMHERGIAAFHKLLHCNVTMQWNITIEIGVDVKNKTKCAV